MYTALGAGVGVDAMIALTLSLSLSQSRTGFKRYVAGVYPDDARSLYVCSTDSLVNILMAYTINTSLLTRLVAPRFPFLFSSLHFISVSLTVSILVLFRRKWAMASDTRI